MLFVGGRLAIGIGVGMGKPGGTLIFAGGKLAIGRGGGTGVGAGIVPALDGGAGRCGSVCEAVAATCSVETAAIPAPGAGAANGGAAKVLVLGALATVLGAEAIAAT